MVGKQNENRRQCLMESWIQKTQISVVQALWDDILNLVV